MMGYRDDECRLVKSSVGQFNVSKDTTTCILENRQVQGIMIILVMMNPIIYFCICREDKSNNSLFASSCSGPNFRIYS